MRLSFLLCKKLSLRGAQRRGNPSPPRPASTKRNINNRRQQCVPPPTTAAPPTAGHMAPPYRHFADFVGVGDPDDPSTPRPHALRRERCPHPAAVPPHRKKPLPHRRVYRCGNFPSYFIPSKNSDRDFCTSCLSRSGRMFPRSSQVNMCLKTSGMASYCRSSCA